MKTTALLSFFVGAMTSAQDSVSTIKNSTLDTSVPDSPAFSVLGLTPTTITHPASPRALASSLLSGVDKNGNFQTGIAIDTAPYMLFFGNQVTLPEYRGNFLVRFLARTQFSLASTKGASESDKSAKLAAGLSLTIFDKGDPRTNQEFIAKLAAIATEVLSQQPSQNPNSSPEEQGKVKQLLEDKVELASRMIRADYKKKSWNRSSWTLSGAPSWISKDGTTSHLAPNGAAIWSSLAYGFESIPGLKDTSQIVFHGRFHSAENVPDAKVVGSFYRQQSTVVGAQVRIGTANTIGSFETVYVHDRPVGRRTDNYFRLTVGAEKQLSDNTWLHFGLGGESENINGQNKLFILGAFNWGVGPKN